jgi:hypothetical protein
VILSFHADDAEDFDHLLILAPTDDGEQAMLYVTSCGGEGTSCPGDLTGDGVVDGGDLLILLGAWGSCSDPTDCPADLNGDGVVDGSDLLILLGNWGLCP